MRGGLGPPLMAFWRRWRGQRAAISRRGNQEEAGRYCALAMRILITNVQLASRTGTEIVVRDLDAEFRRRGHEVCVYTPTAGSLAEEMAANGATVVRCVDDVAFVPDVIHGHHHSPTMETIARFPTSSAVFVCHDRRQADDVPPVAATIFKYVAVDLNCRERLLVDSGIDPARVELIHNAVDLRRIEARATLPGRPARGLVFSNSARPGGFLDSIRSACELSGIELHELGAGIGRASAEPEEELCKADVVFAKARCAIEAMAAGCAVILVDQLGLGSLVTSTQFDRLRDWNFGARCLQAAVTPSGVAAELAKYDPADAAIVRDLVRSSADLVVAVDRYEDLYRRAMEAFAARPARAGWVDNVRAMVGRIEALEQLELGGRGALFAAGTIRPALPPTIGSSITVRAQGPKRVEHGGPATWIVEVLNRSHETLASVGPTPVRLSCHWFDDETGDVVVYDGDRVELTAAVLPGTRHAQEMRVCTPSALGRYVAAITLVQETVFWFDQLDPPVVHRCPIEVVPPGSDCVGASTLGDIADVVGAVVVRDAGFSTLGFSSHRLTGMLSYAESRGHLRRAVQNGASAMIVTPELASEVAESVGVVIVDHPARAFERLHHHLISETSFYDDDHLSVIDPSADVDFDARVAPLNVTIGPDCRVEAGAVLSGRVRLGQGVHIGPGVLLGSVGFQNLVDQHGHLGQYVHVGGIDVADGATVLAGVNIARGLFRQNTVIGERSIVGNNSFVSHNVSIGAEVHVGHGAVVNGNVVIGDRAWIGPGCVIANDLTIGARADVALGSVVLDDVAPGERIAGIGAMTRWAALRARASLSGRKERR